ncbi:hypothetical protein H312_00503 [Anncaliia algerae PRA339]|uniref:Uncharacterized protein n=1 Tax=Anncaliia algerae PRA339 TaxID=1288291 RepID=A0A059F4Z1_9MICR|nr:hypothetical protein H312_00503 [Anncaliia algerae PRA339]
MNFFKDSYELIQIFNNAFNNKTFKLKCSRCNSNANIDNNAKKRKCSWHKCRYQESLLK